MDTKGAGSGLYNRRVLGCITAGFGIEALKNRKNHRKKNKAHTTGSYNRLCGDQELGLDNARLRQGPGGVYWRKVYMGREDERMGGGEDGREGCAGVWRGGMERREGKRFVRYSRVWCGV